MKLQVTMMNGDVRLIPGEKIVQEEDYILGWLLFRVDEQILKFNPDAVVAFSISHD
jgi:hypothetical protein